MMGENIAKKHVELTKKNKLTYINLNSSKTPAGSNLGEHYQIL
jgi:hypothetical protein